MKKLLTLLSLTLLGAVIAVAANSQGTATPLKRGLMAVNSVNGTNTKGGGKGNLVSWRSRKTDLQGYKFKLYRGTSATAQTVALNSGEYIEGKTNFVDANGTESNYYRLEVYDKDGKLLETEVSEKTWTKQTKYIDLEGGAPTDPTSAGATYTPNDASYCDMDGDGEYEIILKWAPSNSKDAASSGTTSPAFYSCYKLDGTRLWMLHTGPNQFNSSHTTQFIAWDLDGDGYGEFMVKTGCGTVDGQGNHLSVDTNPTANYLNSKGKQVSGPEWITVFDGRTGAEIKTINYHTDYSAGASYWGDNNQNRSERYLAAIAWLDGEEGNPSPIFARGYYSGAFIGAYDWDGTNLTLRWRHCAYKANSGKVEYADGSVTNLSETVAGEGAHWISVADTDRDGRQEITYGSGALKPDGTTLYRTGLGHGDALHVGDFDPTRPGLECFMVHESTPYGMDYRDATTGELLLHVTAGGDTGRGIMANFDVNSNEPCWQYSADGYGAVYDSKGNVIKSGLSHGGGAAANFRIYWNGTLSDQFFDKSVIEGFSSSGYSRPLPLVNGTNYMQGHLNNGSKYNPCVQGDLLGDWREEMVTWTEGDTTGYQLIINATNFATDYMLPHLMDDFDYRAQVINQNCCYNQPPHLGYNPRATYPYPYPTEQVNPEPEPEPEPQPVSAELSFGSSYADEITIGDTYGGRTLTNPYNVSVTWSSSNTDVATVDQYGIVTILSPGETTVTATFAGNSEYLAATVSYTIVVSAPEPVSPGLMFVSVDTDVVTLGEDYDEPTLLNPYGVSVTWSSSNTDVVTVNQQGRVTLVSPGETTITATFEGNDEYLAASASYKLIVNEPEPQVSVTNVKANAANAATYNVSGQKTNGSYKGIVIENKKKYAK